MNVTTGGCSTRTWHHDLRSPFSHLLDNNLPLPPHAHLHHDIERIINQAENTKESLLLRVEDLKKRLSDEMTHLENLEAFLHRHRRLAGRRRIANFPPELLLVIFEILVDDTGDDEWTKPGTSQISLNPIWVVSQVSHLWRQVARSSPRLWAYVTLAASPLFVGSEETVKLQSHQRLTRIGSQPALSKRAPLSFRLVVEIPVDYDHQPQWTTHLRSLLQLFFLNSARCRRFSLVVGRIDLFFEEMESYLASNTTTNQTPLFPCLEIFEYDTISSRNSSPHMFPLGSFPSLETLKVTGVSRADMWAPTLPWAQLQTLSISDCDMRWVYDVLHQLRYLQELDLQLPVEEYTRVKFNRSKIVLPSLHTLRIRHFDETDPEDSDDSDSEKTRDLCIWDLPLHAPNLRSFRVDCMSFDSDGYNTIPCLDFSTLLPNVVLLITHFECGELNCGEIEEDSYPLIELLGSMPSLRSLDIGVLMSVWHYSECDRWYTSRTLRHLFTTLQPDIQDPASSVPYDILQHLEHIRLKYRLDACRPRESLLLALLDALEPRFRRGKLRRVDVVFSTPPGVPDFVPAMSATRMEELRRRGVSIRVEQISEEGTGGFEEDEENAGESEKSLDGIP